MRSATSSRFLSIIASPYFVPVCFTLYLGLRLALVVLVPIQQHSDEEWYYHRAVALAAGQGYSENHILTAYWPVGWPGFLGVVFWLVGPSPFIGQMVNWLSAAAIFVLTLRLGTNLFGDALAGRLSVLILTVYPNQIAYVPLLGTEVFYTALLLLAFDLLISGNGWWRPAAAGVAFGIATLTKTQTLLLPAVVFVGWWIVARGERGFLAPLGRLTIVYVLMAAVVLPWSARNYRVFGEIVPISTNGGLTLLTGNNPSARGDYTPDDALVKEVPRDVANQVAADHLATSLALNWVRSHPGAAAALLPRKVWRLWAPDGEGEWSYQKGYPSYERYKIIFRTVRVINQIYYVLIMGLFFASIYYWPRREERSPAQITGYLLVLYTTLISMVFSGQSRFHFPMMPWIAMYAAWTLVQWAGRSRPVVRAAA